MTMCALCSKQETTETGGRAGTRCLHWMLPPRQVTGAPHSLFSAADHPLIVCGSKFHSLCNGSRSLKKACRWIARSVQLADQVIRQREANSGSRTRNDIIVP